MTEKERMTDKNQPPSAAKVQAFLGKDAWARLLRFEAMLQENYEVTRELKFPFGDSYGWGFRYGHKKTLLLYVFFEKDGFCCTLSINDKGAKKVEALLENLLPETQTLWHDRYPCGEKGGWVHYSVKTEAELTDILKLTGAKVAPKKSV